MMTAGPSASARARQPPSEAENQVHYFTDNDKSKSCNSSSKN